MNIRSINSEAVHALGRMGQLDGLRAIAVFAVIAQHTLPPENPLSSLRLGSHAVHLFFVLSGFLITAILLSARDRCENGGYQMRHVLKAFYLRRALRIFPAYYLILAIAFIVGVEDLRGSWEWHFSYLTNVYLAIRGTGHGAVTHLWSLAIEEQFYIVWPLVVLLMPRRWLSTTLSVTVLTGPLFRLGMWNLTQNVKSTTMLMPACADFLGTGAILAYLSRNHVPDASTARVAAYICGGSAALWAFSLQFSESATLVISGLIEAAFFASVIYLCANSMTGVFGRVLNAAPLRFVGLISYGIYLIHHFIPYFFVALERRFDVWSRFPLTHGWASFVAVSVVSTLFAALSWQLIEAPINSFKRFFPYVPSGKTGKGGASQAADADVMLSSAPVDTTHSANRCRSAPTPEQKQ